MEPPKHFPHATRRLFCFLLAGSLFPAAGPLQAMEAAPFDGTSAEQPRATIGLQELFAQSTEGQMGTENNKIVKDVIFSKFIRELVVEVQLLDTYLYHVRQPELFLTPADKQRLRRKLRYLIHNGIGEYNRERFERKLLILHALREDVFEEIHRQIFVKDKKFMKREFQSPVSDATFRPTPGAAGLFYRHWSQQFDSLYQASRPLEKKTGELMTKALHGFLHSHREMLTIDDLTRKSMARYTLLLFDLLPPNETHQPLSTEERYSLQESRHALRKLLSLPFETPASRWLHEEVFQLARTGFSEGQIVWRRWSSHSPVVGIHAGLFLRIQQAIQNATAALPELFPPQAATGQPPSGPSTSGRAQPSRINWNEVVARLEQLPQREERQLSSLAQEIEARTATGSSPQEEQLHQEARQVRRAQTAHSRWLHLRTLIQSTAAFAQRTRSTPPLSESGEAAWQEILERLEGIRRREGMKEGLSEVREEILQQQPPAPTPALEAADRAIIEEIDQLLASQAHEAMPQQLTRLISGISGRLSEASSTTLPLPPTRRRPVLTAPDSAEGEHRPAALPEFEEPRETRSTPSPEEGPH